LQAADFVVRGQLVEPARLKGIRAVTVHRLDELAGASEATGADPEASEATGEDPVAAPIR
jgi:hypothetical protein